MLFLLKQIPVVAGNKVYESTESETNGGFVNLKTRTLYKKDSKILFSAKLVR